MIIFENKTTTCTVILSYEDKDTEVFSGKSIETYFKGELFSNFHLFNEDGNSKVFIGLGKFDELTCLKLKDVFAKISKVLVGLKITQAVIDAKCLIERFGICSFWNISLGFELGLYKYIGYKADNKITECILIFTGIDEKNLEKAICLSQNGKNLAKGIMMARNFVNEPSNKLTPIIFADNVVKLGQKAGFDVEILDETQTAELGMDAFLTVGRSSGNAPRLIVMRYNGDDKDQPFTALVGKGVMCDTGGYNMKTGMGGGIKGDMAGAAAVIGTIYALAKNKVKANVVGIVPSCENRIAPDSFLPGDIISSMAGKSIEVLNTDAEGRLILADAVTYAIRKENATRIIDVATLTGAAGAAYGISITPALSSNDEFWSEFETAYKTSGEQFWRLPIFPEHRKMIEGKISDIKNMGESYCGTITAALFIEAFTEKLPWIHLDIAGSACSYPPVFEHQTDGPTGVTAATMYCMFDKLI